MQLLTPRVLLPILLALLLLGCGGAQSGKGPDIAWDNIPEAIPGNATWVLYADPADVGAEYRQLSFDNALSQLQVAGLLAPFEDATGLKIRTHADLAALGFAELGPMAVFSSDILPVALFQLGDVKKFRNTIDTVRKRNPDLAWGTRKVAGVEFTTVAHEKIVVWIGAANDVGIVHVHVPELKQADPAATLSAVLTGSHDSGRFLEGEVAASLRKRLQAGDRLDSLFVFRMEVIDRILRLDDSTDPNFDAMGLDDAGAWQDDAERTARCDLEAERMLTAFPWFGYVGGSNPADFGDVYGQFVLSLSGAAAERLRPVFPASLAVPPETEAGPALYAAMRFDFRRFIDWIDWDPALAECRNIAVLGGGMANLKQTFGRNLSNASFVQNGGYAFAFYAARMAGFAPTFDGMLMVGSDNVPELVTWFQRRLEEAGATGSVDKTSTWTTYRYRLLHLGLRIIQLQDRAVLAMGDVPEADVTAFAEAAGEPNGHFFRARINPVPFAAAWQFFLDFMRDSGSMPEEQLADFEASMGTLLAIESAHMTGRWDDSALIFESDMQMDTELLLQNLREQAETK